MAGRRARIGCWMMPGKSMERGGLDVRHALGLVIGYWRITLIEVPRPDQCERRAELGDTQRTLRSRARVRQQLRATLGPADSRRRAATRANAPRRSRRRF